MGRHPRELVEEIATALGQDHVRRIMFLEASCQGCVVRIRTIVGPDWWRWSLKGERRTRIISAISGTS
jgi:hypothetical protein